MGLELLYKSMSAHYFVPSGKNCWYNELMSPGDTSMPKTAIDFAVIRLRLLLPLDTASAFRICKNYNARKSKNWKQFIIYLLYIIYYLLKCSKQIYLDVDIRYDYYNKCHCKNGSHDHVKLIKRFRFWSI
jgi:hypothetical protein